MLPPMTKLFEVQNSLNIGTWNAMLETGKSVQVAAKRGKTEVSPSPWRPINSSYPVLLLLLDIQISHYRDNVPSTAILNDG